MGPIGIDREVGPVAPDPLSAPYHVDEKRLERLRKQRVIEMGRLQVRDEWTHRLLVRAGAGGTY